MAKQSRVIAAGRSTKLKARWDDPTKGADGLTYRERQAKAQSERMQQLHANARKEAPAQGATKPAAAPIAPSTRDGTVVLGTSDPAPVEKPAAQSPQTPAAPPAAPATPGQSPAPRARIGRVFR